MPRSTSLKPSFRKARERGGLAAWVINVPENLSSTGNRQELFFKTKTEAQAVCDELRARQENFGISLTALTPAKIAVAAECYNLLEPYGIDLRDAVRFYIQRHKDRSASVTLEESPSLC
jgi:hypothetical protein